jgi:hypothetical protein
MFFSFQLKARWRSFFGFLTFLSAEVSTDEIASMRRGSEVRSCGVDLRLRCNFHARDIQMATG